MLVELERLRVASVHKRRVSDGAFEYAEGIFYSGLLHESQKSHLRKVLNRRQTEAGAHEKQMTLSHRQIMQARFGAKHFSHKRLRHVNKAGQDCLSVADGHTCIWLVLLSLYAGLVAESV